MDFPETGAKVNIIIFYKSMLLPYFDYFDGLLHKANVREPGNYKQYKIEAWKYAWLRTNISALIEATHWWGHHY